MRFFRLLSLIFVSIIFLAIPVHVIGDDVVNDLQNKINDYVKKLDELAKSKDTLSNQIKIINSQVELTALKISQTESAINSLQVEIADLTLKIQDLDVTLNKLSSAYIEQVAQNYKLSRRLPKFLFILSNNFNSFLEDYKYLSTVQKNNQNTLVNMETVRTNYDLQKEKKKQKQAELENLQQQLANQKDALAKQKQNKTNLLEVTKNDEVRYQQLKRAAEDELNSLLKAKFVGKRNVKKGEPIGIMGNTGYSFGDHLHFGLYNLKESELSAWTYQNDIDSSDYLNSHSWPMNQPITITQGRGHTKYSYLYADKFHHGIDMYSDNKTIIASDDGVAYFFRNAGSSLGNHVKLFHSDGKMTLYLHMQ